MTDIFNPPRLLKTREVAAYLNVTLETLRKYRDRGSGPPFVRLLPKTLRYPSDGLNEWLATAEAQRTKTVHKGVHPGMVHIGGKISKEDMAEVERNHPSFAEADKQATS